MIAPYKQNFTVTQAYGHQGHRGIDLSAAWGVGDLTIICVQSGQCVHAGWDNGGYGYCVVIRDDLNRYWIYGHMSKVSVGVNGRVNQGESVGVEGNTGASKGIHLHLEVRQGGWNRGDKSLDVSAILGIPNRTGLVVNQSQAVTPVPPVASVPELKPTYNFKYIYSDKIKELQQILNSKGFTLTEDGLFGINTLNALRKYTIEINDSGTLTKWTQEFLASKGYNVGIVDGIAGPQTMFGIEQFQHAKKLGTVKRNGYTYLGGDDWYYLIEE